MKDAEFVFFLNKAKTSFKMLQKEGYLLMFRGTRRLTLNDIERVPSLFGSRLDVASAKQHDKLRELLGFEGKVSEDGELQYIG
jgi:hypothetical protein